MESLYEFLNWAWAKTGMTALVPIWFVGLGWASWGRSLIAGLVVINVGALLKVIWSFYFAGDSAWSIIPAVSIGALICNGILIYAFRRKLWPAEAE